MPRIDTSTCNLQTDSKCPAPSAEVQMEIFFLVEVVEVEDEEEDEGIDLSTVAPSETKTISEGSKKAKQSSKVFKNISKQTPIAALESPQGKTKCSGSRCLGSSS